MNAKWHSEHKLPHGSSMDRRIEWHLEHANVCGCRPMPKSIEDAIRERQIRANAN